MVSRAALIPLISITVFRTRGHAESTSKEWRERFSGRGRQGIAVHCHWLNAIGNFTFQEELKLNRIAQRDHAGWRVIDASNVDDLAVMRRAIGVNRNAGQALPQRVQPA